MLAGLFSHLSRLSTRLVDTFRSYRGISLSHAPRIQAIQVEETRIEHGIKLERFSSESVPCAKGSSEAFVQFGKLGTLVEKLGGLRKVHGGANI